jgi:hypothetical protein
VHLEAFQECHCPRDKDAGGWGVVDKV